MPMATAFAELGHEIILFTVSREHRFRVVRSIEKGVHVLSFQTLVKSIAVAIGHWITCFVLFNHFSIIST